MKKLTLSFATLAAATALVACEQNTHEAAPAAKPAPASQAAPAPEKKEEPAVQIELKDENGSIKINAD